MPVFLWNTCFASVILRPTPLTLFSVPWRLLYCCFVYSNKMSSSLLTISTQLSSAHDPSLILPFLGLSVSTSGHKLVTNIYNKPTDSCSYFMHCVQIPFWLQLVLLFSRWKAEEMLFFQKWYNVNCNVLIFSFPFNIYFNNMRNYDPTTAWCKLSFSFIGWKW